MVRFDPHELPDAARDFLSERHLASLTTFRADGSAHVVPVGFTFQAPAFAWVITNDRSVKVRNASAAGTRGALCQIDGRYWLTLEGSLTVTRDAAQIAGAVERYAARYRRPRVNPTRVALRMTVDRVMGNV